MADINIFNSFSFKKWSERLREQKIEEEIQRQRMDQVARLRDKLGRERNLREQADMLNDDDIDQLINYLNAGGTLTGGVVSGNVNGQGAVGASSMTTNGVPSAQPNNEMMLFGHAPKSDAYIMNEIKNYSKKKNIATIPQTIFSYNRRYTEMLKERAKAVIQNPREIDANKLKLYEFEYNRRNLV